MRRPIFGALASTALLLLPACANYPDALQRHQAQAPITADEARLLIVHCLIPGSVRMLGAFSQTITPRRAVRATADECAAMGGEYAASPNTDPLGALKIWLPFANEGDTDAQVTVGELYERGAAGGPDPELAARWYERALAKGNARAMVNLASLYERGSGVRKDLQQARELLRRAGGWAMEVSRPSIQLIDPPIFFSALRMRGPSGVAGVTLPAGGGPFMLTGQVQAHAGIAEVSVNGLLRPVDGQGLFTTQLALAEQPLTLHISATDRAGTTTMVDFTVTPSGSAPAPPAAAALPGRGGQRYALVIANQNYQHLEKLDTPVADGRALAELLQKRFGFEVILLADATRRQVLGALNGLRAKVGADDDVLVYYAGHGEMDAITARGYWVPVDGEKDSLAQWISVIDITDQLAAMSARHALVIADSCYSGTLGGSLVPRIDEALAQDARRSAIARLSRQRSRVAMSSGGLEPVLDGDGGPHSLYARSLLDVLAHLQAPVQAHELHAAVAARFVFLAQSLKLQQQPQYAPIGFAGHESGDFLLKPLTVEVR